MRAHILLLFILILFGCTACDSGKKNEVPLDQIQPDHTNDYKYIFKDIIKEQKEKEQSQGRDEFKR